MSRRSNIIRQAVILAGGEGRRLRPYSRVLPKPLWPVGNVPIAEILIRQLAGSGIKEIVMAVGFQAELIRMIIGDGRQFGVKIRYSEEERPLGTAAPLKKVKKLESNFLVLNGDILTDLKFKDFIQSHVRSNSVATVAVFNRSVKVDFGVVTARKGAIEQYDEKPVLKYSVSMGVYAFSKDVLRYIPNRKFDFPDLVGKLIEIGQPPAVYRFGGRWLDIGRPDDWERADKIFQRKPKVFL